MFCCCTLVHSTTLKEKYEAVKYVLEKIHYGHMSALFTLTWRWWIFCWDKFGFTKYHAFYACGISRDTVQHYTENDWPVQEELIPCRITNIINKPLVDQDRTLFPLVHIKLGLIKQFTKTLDKNCGCITYLCQAFPGLMMEKLKASIFDGPQIHQLVRNLEFKNSM